MTSSPPAKTFNWRNLWIRLISAFTIIPVVALAVWAGGWWYLALISLVGALLSREWGRLVAPQSAWTRAAFAIGVAVIAVLLASHLKRYDIAWILIPAGALLAGVLVRQKLVDVAYGVIYIAPAGIGMIWLRQTEEGAAWTVLLFATAWLADVTAFAVGSILKGPKLWPRFSPNKTWSGFIGGLLGATITGGLTFAYFLLFDLHFVSLPAAMAIGFAAGLATMAGDLWESMLKRRYGVKDSGGLIPGHGGMLDRCDGLMFAVMVVCFARWAVQQGWIA